MFLYFICSLLPINQIHRLKSIVHVNHLLVVIMLFVQNRMVLAHVNACQIIMEIHILVVDRNAFSILTVLVQRLVSTPNVLIHALAAVD